MMAGLRKRAILPIGGMALLALLISAGAFLPAGEPVWSSALRWARPGPVEFVSGYRPLALHPSNPQYFLFREQPTVLITSGEHYGAVLNADFDFVRYLDELQTHGLNLTRTFAGPYREEPEILGLPDNSLAPLRPETYVAPWPRTDEPGAADGGNKFDLAAWNPAYFDRLRAFVAEAGRRGIVVEVVFFSSMYFNHRWELSPLHARNNVNGVGRVDYTEVHTLREPALVDVQARLVARIVEELAEADNVYYEIINEPYAKPGEGGGLAFDAQASFASLQWQERMIEALADAESGLEQRHLIAQNVSGESIAIPAILPDVSVLNFHYGSSESVRLNAHWRRPIVLDETGGLGVADEPYRWQAWAFILAGGAGVSHLDLTFTPGHEDGSAVPLPPDALGGGGPSLRSQFGILKSFIDSVPFVDMAPDYGFISEGVPPGAQVYVLSKPGEVYAAYLAGGNQANFLVRLPPGASRVEWSDTTSGQVSRLESIAGGTKVLASPPYRDEVALRIRRVSGAAEAPTGAVRNGSDRTDAGG